MNGLGKEGRQIGARESCDWRLLTPLEKLDCWREQKREEALVRKEGAKDVQL